MSDPTHVRFPTLALKTMVVHTITYSLMGILAAAILHYGEQFARPDMASWMRQINDPLVMAGPLFQPIRGLVFALVFYPFREALFARKNGWLNMWWMLVGLGIVSTFGPPPGSIEGLIYTKIPIWSQLSGYLEVVPQAFLLSLILFYWVRHPEKRWLTWGLSVVCTGFLLLIVIGLFVTKPA